MENVKANASAAVSAVQNHPLTQSVTNGPVVENVKDQSAKTQAEFSNLAASRTRPSTSTATGQPLTHYHSFFSSLLSWDNPRASGIAYGVTVLSIFALRYLDILRYSFKVTYMALFVTVLAEVTGKALFSHGFITQFRPKKYYTLSKETLESTIGDVHELINFFVIETQRILFVENVFLSGAAFVASFLSYYLIKLVPVWGLALISTSVLFLSPLIYKTNQELIDHHLANASRVINQQTEQVKHLASEHIAHATETTKQYVGDYSTKAQEMIRNRSVSPIASRPAKTELKETTNGIKEEEPSPEYKAEDFPEAPKEEFKSAAPVDLQHENEPLVSL